MLSTKDGLLDHVLGNIDTTMTPRYVCILFLFFCENVLEIRLESHPTLYLDPAPTISLLTRAQIKNGQFAQFPTP